MKARRKLAADRDPRWALWDRFEIPNYDGPGNYLTRLRLIQTPLFGVYLHRFDGPDPRDTLHEHPWPFVSIVLRGGYIERRLDPHTMEVDENRVVRYINVKHAHNAHAIIRLLRYPTWTLMVVGRRTKTWGYLERLEDLEPGDQSQAWVWTEFDKHDHALEFQAAMERRRG